MASVLLTVGYEQCHLDAFVGALRARRVETVIDVRLNPVSRKPGFSKTALATALRAGRIRYLHWPQLGCPREIRRAYGQNGDFSSYAHAFTRQVLTEAGRALAELAELAVQQRVCLLCFERDPERCHRSLVAQAAARVIPGRVTVEHLVVPAAGSTCR